MLCALPVSVVRGVTLVQIAEDFRISNASSNLWLRNAKIEEGLQPGVTQAQAEELRAANKRIRLLEQENEVLRRGRGSLDISLGT